LTSEAPVEAIADLLKNPNGGTWTDGGSPEYFNDQDEAFAYGAQQMEQNGWWNTEPEYSTSFNAAFQKYNGGEITAGIVQGLFEATWKLNGQATQISAVQDGNVFYLSYTATGTGYTHITPHSMDEIQWIINEMYICDRFGCI
jgi:hypothetical protein